MGEVKRWRPELITSHYSVGSSISEPAEMNESRLGEYVLHSDYARLEREHAAAQSELTRLRAVEAAANVALDHWERGDDRAEEEAAFLSLAEACGRKG